MALNWIILYNEPFSNKTEIIYHLCQWRNENHSVEGI